MIGLTSINKFLNESKKKKILKDVRNSAYEIINKKGNTAYGIGMCLRNITDAIFNNSNSIFTISSYNTQLRTCVGMPTIINRNGVREILKLDMTQQEKEELNTSISAIKKSIKTLNL